MHQLIDRKKKFFFYIIILLFLSTFNNKSLEDLKENFFNIKIIELNGVEDDLIFEIQKSLNFLFHSNIFFIDKTRINDELNQFNYIQEYRVYKKFPSNIIINLKKTDLLGITIKNNKKYYIGSNYKLINYEMFKDENNLPMVFGKFVEKDFVKLLNKINSYKLENIKIKTFLYFQNSRWDIKTTNDILIKLPNSNLDKALIYLKKIYKNKELLEKKIIDLRIPNQVIIL